MYNFSLMYHDIQASIHSVFPTFYDMEVASIPDCNVLNHNFYQINLNAKKLRFFQQDAFLQFSEMGYEERIFYEGIIATRKHNWHDFFNAMVWRHFPKIKCAINAVHIQEIKKQKNTQRSRKRDLLTLFDECGVIILAKKHHLEMIRQHHWHDLFVENKEFWLSRDIEIITFGHAMFEKYLNPYIGMTAQALLLEKTDKNIDELISKAILNQKILLSKADLAPLPVLGIPDWCVNQNKEFYANKNYFRS